MELIDRGDAGPQLLRQDRRLGTAESGVNYSSELLGEAGDAQGQFLDAAGLLKAPPRVDPGFEEMADLGLESFRRARPSLLAAEVGEQAVARYPAEPCPEVAFLAEVSEVTPGRDEHFLSQVIGFGAVIESAGHIAAQAEFMSAYDFQLEPRLASQDALKQRGKVEVFGFHDRLGLCFLSKMCRPTGTSHTIFNGVASLGGRPG